MFDENGNYIGPQAYAPVSYGLSGKLGTSNSTPGFSLPDYSAQATSYTSTPVNLGVGQRLANQAGDVASSAAPVGALDSFKNWFNDFGFLQQRKADGSTSGGWGSAMLGTAQGIGGLYMGMKQYGLMKDQLAFNKDTFNKNYAAQRQMTNSAMEDRQKRRVLENTAATPVADYMAKYGIK